MRPIALTTRSMALLLALMLLAGCGHKDEKKNKDAGSSSAQSEENPSASSVDDALIASADTRLNEISNLLSARKLFEANARLTELEPVTARLTDEQRKFFNQCREYYQNAIRGAPPAGTVVH